MRHRYVTSIVDREVEVSFPSAGGPPRVVVYQGAAVDQLEHAWATTVHKAQGGESDIVVLAIGNKAPASLLHKQLLYTAVTRAKRLLVVVAAPQVLQRAVATVPGVCVGVLGGGHILYNKWGRCTHVLFMRMLPIHQLHQQPTYCATNHTAPPLSCSAVCAR